LSRRKIDFLSIFQEKIKFIFSTWDKSAQGVLNKFSPTRLKDFALHAATKGSQQNQRFAQKR